MHSLIRSASQPGIAISDSYNASFTAHGPAAAQSPSVYPATRPPCGAALAPHHTALHFPLSSSSSTGADRPASKKRRTTPPDAHAAAAAATTGRSTAGMYVAGKRPAHPAPPTPAPTASVSAGCSTPGALSPSPETAPAQPQPLAPSSCAPGVDGVGSAVPAEATCPAPALSAPELLPLSLSLSLSPTPLPLLDELPGFAYADDGANDTAAAGEAAQPDPVHGALQPLAPPPQPMDAAEHALELDTKPDLEELVALWEPLHWGDADYGAAVEAARVRAQREARGWLDWRGRRGRAGLALIASERVVLVGITHNGGLHAKATAMWAERGLEGA